MVLYDATVPADHEVVLGPAGFTPYSHAYMDGSPIAVCGVPLQTLRQTGLPKCPDCLRNMRQGAWVAR